MLTAYPGPIWSGEFNQLNTITNCTLMTDLKTTTLGACGQMSMPSQTINQKTAHPQTAMPPSLMNWTTFMLALIEETQSQPSKLCSHRTACRSHFPPLTCVPPWWTCIKLPALMASLAECLGPVQNSWLRSSPTFFNLSLTQAIVPNWIKTATIVPVTKHACAVALNDFCPVDLTPIIAKWFFPTWKNAFPQHWTHTSSPTNHTGQQRMPSPQLSTLPWRTWTEPTHMPGCYSLISVLPSI